MNSGLSSAIAFGSRIHTIHTRILPIPFDLNDSSLHLVYANGTNNECLKDDSGLSTVTKVTLAELACISTRSRGLTYRRHCGQHHAAIGLDPVMWDFESTCKSFPVNSESATIRVCGGKKSGRPTSVIRRAGSRTNGVERSYYQRFPIAILGTI
jgi:hypothetical protein